MLNILHIPHNPALPSGLTALRDEAAAQGFRFLERLASEWESGANRFARPGECLLGAFLHGQLIGVGGLNCDPYAAAADIGRLRHLYVLSEYRRQGVASAIVLNLIARAHGRFRELRLRTNSASADSFYRNLGFTPFAGLHATHAMTIRRQRPAPAGLL